MALHTVHSSASCLQASLPTRTTSTTSPRISTSAWSSFCFLPRALSPRPSPQSSQAHLRGLASRTPQVLALPGAGGKEAQDVGPGRQRVVNWCAPNVYPSLFHLTLTLASISSRHSRIGRQGPPSTFRLLSRILRAPSRSDPRQRRAGPSPASPLSQLLRPGTRARWAGSGLEEKAIASTRHQLLDRILSSRLRCRSAERERRCACLNGDSPARCRSFLFALFSSRSALASKGS